MTSRHQIRRLALAATITTLLVWCASVQAKTAVVYLKDRDVPLKGELVQETTDKLILKISGINTPINKADVVRMDWELSLTEQYQEKRAKIANDDYQQRYDLAEWASQQSSLEGDQLAAAELQQIVQAKPDYREAKLLLELVKQRIKAAQQPANPQPTTPAPQQPQAQQPAPAKADEVPLLSREDVNLIKVMELDLRTKPGVTILPKVIDEFLDEFRTNPAVAPYLGPDGARKFKGLKGYEQVEVLFAAKASKFYKDIIVRDEPKPLADFRNTYYPTLVLRQCGSCHAEGKHHGPYIITDKPTLETVTYTNFLILTRASVKGQAMIDRATPADSLLLQYALPRDQAKYPHPDVKNFKPYFRTMQDRSYIDAVQWVGSLYSGNGDNPYPVSYSVPTAKKGK